MLNLKIKSIITSWSLKKFLAFSWMPVFMLLFAFSAHAQFDPITDWASRKILNTILYFILTVVVKGVAAFAQLLDYAIRLPMLSSTGEPWLVVRESWELMRDFANMFFIVGLIIMAFGTIFSVSKYDFRNLIVRFLIAALLINFSLVIGATIIDWTQSLSDVFITSIGSIGNQIAQNLGISETLLGVTPQGGASFIQRLLRNGPISVASEETARVLWDAMTADNKDFNGMISMFFTIIFGFILMFSLIVGFLMALIRVPILAILLVLSPVAWLCSILPQTQNINRRWWSLFLGWNLFLPIYLFFIYFGVFFMSRRVEIYSSMPPSMVGISQTPEQVLGFLLAALFLIGGAKIAMSSSLTAGAGGVAAGIWARGTANARLQRNTYLGGAYRSAYNATPIPGAYKEARDYVTREGFAGTKLENIPVIGGYRGQRGADERKAAILGGLGVPGVAERQIQKNIQGAEQKFKDSKKYDEDALITTLKTGTLEEKIAASNRLKELGRNLTGPEIAPIFQEYRKTSPSEAVRWIRGQNIENLSREDLAQLEGIDPQLSQKVARIKSKRNLYPDADRFAADLARFKNNEGEMVGFLGDSKEFIDGLDKDSALKLFTKLDEFTKENPGMNYNEAKKKLSTQLAEKGFITDKLKELTTGGETGNGIFSSTSEVEKLLDLAKKATPLEALTLKAEKGLLKDAYTREKLEGPDGIMKALKQEFDKIDTEGMAKIKSSEEKKTGFYDPMVLAAFKNSLSENKRAADRIKGMYMDPKFTNNAPLVKSIDGALEEVRLMAFMRDAGEPFKAKVKEITDVLLPEINKAKTAGNNQAAELATEKTRRALKQADGQLSAITKLDFIRQDIKEEFTSLLSGASARFKSIGGVAQQKKEQGSKSGPQGPGNKIFE